MCRPNRHRPARPRRLEPTARPPRCTTIRSRTQSAGLRRIDGRWALQSTRRIIDDLCPQLLEELGLVAALDAMATQFARRTGLQCGVDQS